MAEAIPFGLVQKIIERLGSTAFKEIGSIWGVKDELENLKNTFSAIQAVLQDAEEKQDTNNQVRDWLMKLRDVAYDADDVLSDFSTEDLRRRVMYGDKMAKKVRIFFSSSNQLAFRFKMAHKIKAIREKLDAIANDKNNLRLEVSPLQTRVVARERDQTHSFIRDEEVIGREDDKKTIIDMLLKIDEEENVSFISIVGIGGQGKTTLAQYVFNDEKVKSYFELKMWVCVSDVFDVKTIAEKIIGSATGQLTSLQTLPLFVVSEEDHAASSSKHCGGLAELNKLNNLRGELCIKNLAWVTDATLEAKAANLKEKRHLRNREITDEGWWRRDIVDAATTTSISSDQYQQHISLPSFPCLSYLDIWNCNNLTCMPLFPYLEEKLELVNTSFKPLQETMAMTMNMSATSSLPSSSSSSPPLSKLKSLTLRRIQDVDSLPEELLKNLTSLQRLCISNYPNLTSLPEGIGNLTSLQSLDISDCPNLTSLPEGIGNLTSLQSLDISNCPNLTSLPEGIGNLTSLQSLDISDCPNLDLTS
uniref:Rx N-terminal domain-containing protein n=1 Tax=Fagus sylvatica TaxID=28930 RepID=A0A2N9GEH4_FAGSY